MKKTILFLSVLLILGLAMPVAASWRTVETNDSRVLAWIEDDVLFVAIANPSWGRERFSIEPATGNRSSNNAFERRTINVPSRSLLLESIEIGSTWHPRWDGEIEEISVESTLFSRTLIPVQRSTASVSMSNFIAPADSLIEVDVQLSSLLGDRMLNRLRVDPDFGMLTSTHTGRVTINSFAGGYQYNSARNEITYQDPTMTLRLRTPNIRDIGLLTFDISHYDSRDRPEVLASPVVLIYGSDYAWIDNTTTAPTTRTTR